MKKTLFVITIAILTFSCTPKIYPVQNHYADLPYTVRTENTFDNVWDKLVDLFAQNGLSIKLIDRSSGLIVSDNSPITTTWEDKHGDLVHPDADIVVPKMKQNDWQVFIPFFGGYYKKSELKNPSVVRGEWNVRIKKDGEGAIINVNLVNVTYEDWDRVRKVSMIRNLSDFKSTGNFEREIAEFIK